MAGVARSGLAARNSRYPCDDRRERLAYVRPRSLPMRTSRSSAFDSASEDEIDAGQDQLELVGGHFANEVG